MGRKQLTPERTITTGFTTLPSLHKQFVTDCRGTPTSVVLRKLEVYYHNNKDIIDILTDPAGYTKKAK